MKSYSDTLKDRYLLWFDLSYFEKSNSGLVYKTHPLSTTVEGWQHPRSKTPKMNKVLKIVKDKGKSVILDDGEEYYKGYQHFIAVEYVYKYMITKILQIQYNVADHNYENWDEKEIFLQKMSDWFEKWIKEDIVEPEFKDWFINKILPKYKDLNEKYNIVFYPFIKGMLGEMACPEAIKKAIKQLQDLMVKE